MKPYIDTPEIKESRIELVKQELHFAVNSLKQVWHDIINPQRH